MNKKLKLGLFIFLLGFVGVLSTLTMDIPLPEEIQKVISEIFTPWQFKLLTLLNPIILLIVAVALGTLLYDKVNFKMPIIESLIYKDKKFESTDIIWYGIIGGIISGILIIITAIVFNPYLPIEFIEIGEKFKPNLAVRFLYGGITEEILMRFGLMTILVWVVSKLSGKLNPTVYWIGILIAAIIFGFGHLPIVFTLVGAPTMELISYILIGNAVGGIVFGWLYWKKGLEAAMIAHIFAHITMLIGENLFNI